MQPPHQSTYRWNVLLHPEKVDPFISLAMLRDYLALANASRIAEVSKLDQISLCGRQLAATDQRSTLRLQDRHFARLAGDVVELFACPKVTATLRVAEHCYQDIPVSIKDRATEDLFIDVDRRIIRRSSPVRPCSGEFPLRIRGDLSWWRIDPAIQAEPAQYARHPHASSQRLQLGEPST